jgi:hypothetical protein
VEKKNKAKGCAPQMVEFAFFWFVCFFSKLCSEKWAYFAEWCSDNGDSSIVQVTTL